MTISEAAKLGHKRIRRKIWGFPDAYLRITIFPNGSYGPWALLFSRTEQQLIGESTPQPPILILTEKATDWEPYTGKLDEADGGR